MKTTFNTGNFSLVIEGELSEEKKLAMLDAGVKYVVQRDVASKVYIQLAGVAGKKADKVLPEGFQRDSVKFNADNAAAFEIAAESEMAKLGRFTVKVTEYVAGEDSAGAGKLAVKAAEAYIAAGKASGVAIRIAEICGFEVGDAMNAESLALGIKALNAHMAAKVKAETSAALEV